MSEPSRSGERAITVRRMDFHLPEQLDPIVLEGRPEESYIFLGISLLLPYLEPYLIRTMREAKARVTDPALVTDLERFNGQEGQHYRQHTRFNEVIRPTSLAALTALEAEVDADYRRYTATRSLRFNLAYAEGFEAFTTAIARFSLEIRQFDGVHPAVRDLFQWHLIEELEHRTVAFDVYNHVCRGYVYRLAVGLFAQWHLNQFALRAAGIMQDADPEAFRKKWGGPRAAFARLRPFLWQALRLFFPKLLATYLPWYTPTRSPCRPRRRSWPSASPRWLCRRPTPRRAPDRAGPARGDTDLPGAASRA
ncbi:MAG: metal-dependent hydrolase [Byssovorax sp.]